MRVADLGLDPRIVEILKKQGIEELYPPQADAIGPALLGENLVLAIPTASGKSLVAYLAILASVLRGGKALYIVPLRALAAEKYEDLKEFESIGVKVGISVGDYDSADPTLEKFDVIVATSERADSLLRHRTQWLQQHATYDRGHRKSVGYSGQGGAKRKEPRATRENRRQPRRSPGGADLDGSPPREVHRERRRVP